jgi:hypothetical protein
MTKLPAYLRKALNDPEKETQLVAEAASNRIDIRILLGVYWGLFSEQEARRFSAEKLATWIVRAAYDLRRGQKIGAIRRALLGVKRVRRGPQVNPERAAAYRYMRAQLDSLSD